MEPYQSTQSDELDELLTILADQYRRDVLSYFRDTSTVDASVDDLVSEVREQGHGTEEQVAIRLSHVTLPRLAEAGVIEYDTRSETVKYHGHPELEALFNGVTEC